MALTTVVPAGFAGNQGHDLQIDPDKLTGLSATVRDGKAVLVLEFDPANGPVWS